MSLYENDENVEEQIRNFYNVAQLRAELWFNLKSTVDQIAQKGGRKSEPPEVKSIICDIFDTLRVVENYWAYPGSEKLERLIVQLEKREYGSLLDEVSDIVRMMSSEGYRSQPVNFTQMKRTGSERQFSREPQKDRHYFEVLLVDNIFKQEEDELRQKLYELRSSNDRFIYEIVVVRTLQDALIALLFNYNIQSVVIRYGFPLYSKLNLKPINQFVKATLRTCSKIAESGAKSLGPQLGKMMKRFRPEVDMYFVTDLSIDNIEPETHDNFRRIFYRQDDLQDLHLSILKGIQERYEAPFFTALKDYSQRPTGVFHALPISRGNSVFRSHWIRDMGEFYGRNIFMAETSATTGGLDSLLQPTGPIKKAQELAARAFGAQHTYFVTNGTSTANKIVTQALIHPGDIVLVDRDCHKSHHYALVLNGGFPVYMDSYPIIKYSMYGAVPLETIKKTLYKFKEEGRLDKVKMLLLTNCTFDGLVYNVERVMQEVLAIKPDMIFLWDEAWFAFACFNYTYRRRTAMTVASKLNYIYKTEKYRQQYLEHVKKCRQRGIEPAMPDPDKVKIRVYGTQSTHKTLTSLRQGSMIHVYDEIFQKQVEESFQEAYMTHTSTSPNYQILASLDVGRKQAELEGFERVEKSIEMAMTLRERITNHTLLKKYFDIVTVEDFIPEKFRDSDLRKYYDPKHGWSSMGAAWEKDEFVIDPTKITLFIGRTGIDGDTFKKVFLMDQFGIQVNKTTRNTVLFMTNIGTTRSSVAFLIGVLMKIARQIEDLVDAYNEEELRLHKKKVISLTEHLPPLPHFSYFHRGFRTSYETTEGDIRKAFFLAYNKSHCEYMKMHECEEAMEGGREVVSSSFVIPYPPGFPILVPGQVITREILDFMQELEVKEIHSYRHDLGLCVFTEETLQHQVVSRGGGGGIAKSKQSTSGKKEETGNNKEEKKKTTIPSS